MALAIEVRQLSKVFDEKGKKFHAVNSLDLLIEEGQVFGFLGPNGAGKTTTIKMICGLITQTQGKVLLNGYDVLTERHQAMKQIGVVLEGARNIYWQLSAWENLLYYGRLKGYYGKELHNQATGLLHDLDLWDRRHELVGSFSRGTQQKVSIACALVANPSIILLDEPTLGLDVQAARTVKAWIAKLAEEQRKTIVLTTHQLDIAEQLCDRVAIINKGRLIANKSIDELLTIVRQEQYQIKVAGYLNKEQSKLFDGFTIDAHHDKTILSGTLTNSQELYSIFEKMKKHGLLLLSATKLNHNLEEVFLQLMNSQT